MKDWSIYTFIVSIDIDEYTKKLLRAGIIENGKIPEDYDDIFCFEYRGLNNGGKHVFAIDFVDD
jgi:hypothetical protein